MAKELLVAIVGPTGVGKTALAVPLTEEFGGEIVSVDSRQVYRHMDIGTGKPAPGERDRAVHHLIDVVDPNEEFSVALFQDLARKAVEDIHRRGGVPFVVGGTGHYVWAMLEGLRLPQVAPNPELRRELAAIAEEEGGIEELHYRLSQVDPVAAERIDPRNVRRVIRAIEVTRATGRPFSEVGTREAPPYRALILGLTAERSELYRRIDARVEAMIERGWVEEVRRLFAMGYDTMLPSMSSLGYRELCRHLAGEMGLAETIERIKIETHRFVRGQYGWFRLADPRIRWLDITASPHEVAREAVRRFLEG